MVRDFTYIDDIVEGIVRVLDRAPVRDDSVDLSDIDGGISRAPWRIFNIGRGQPIPLTDFIYALEAHFQVKAVINYDDMQPGDVESTYSDTSRLQSWVDWSAKTSVQEGIKNFIDWYNQYYQLKQSK